MKKVKCNTGELMGLTYGKVYEVEKETRDGYFILEDTGKIDYAHKSHFTEVNDIEVGSVWINKQDGKEVKVDYASDHIVVYADGVYHASPRLFNVWYKPKPKTVTMYFYKQAGGSGYYASTYKAQYTPIAFTREIELP